MKRLYKYDSLEAFTEAKDDLPDYAVCLVTENGKRTVYYSGDTGKEELETLLDAYQYDTIIMENWQQ